MSLKTKCKDLFDALLEKDIHIQELEDKNEDLETKLNKVRSSGSHQMDQSELNQILTLNSGLKSNVKSLKARIEELENSNNDLTLKGKKCEI